MTSLIAYTALIVILVAAAVIPRRPCTDATTFPWFWVVFPITALALAMALASQAPIAPLGVQFGWTMYESELPEDIFPWNTLFWIITSIIGLVLSIWTWRRGRF
ncbi:hypothetical protein CAPI_00510 [Corynebacterium capitovis DSM 44611]|uniref:hypothetical protein n=1 Tax=Corynebacterium capitovis TaxID=131081 RepID=UPI000373843A|nr:hypothetical protein [Corynebacterium capitovis]WKD56684.1 hypothetical protein CAPI_00510 [Corynebacterium capitovis DSM 44611]